MLYIVSNNKQTFKYKQLNRCLSIDMQNRSKQVNKQITTINK